MRYDRALGRSCVPTYGPDSGVNCSIPRGEWQEDDTAGGIAYVMLPTPASSGRHGDAGRDRLGDGLGAGVRDGLGDRLGDRLGGGRGTGYVARLGVGRGTRIRTRL